MRLTCQLCHRVMEYSSARPLFCSYCGKPLAIDQNTATEEYLPPTTVPTPDTQHPLEIQLSGHVGPYQLKSKLGQGGMGSVYEAEDTRSGKVVALKIISPEYASSETSLNRFRQEGRLASQITHPRCVFVLGADEHDGHPYIVMELVQGMTLDQLVMQEGPLPVEKAVPMILDVIEGLQEAHRLGVIHRDVKPSNCFLMPDGRVKIGDFGISKSLVKESSLTNTGTFLGTLLFASPEQIKGEGVDFRSDVYSVAATLYYLLTGRAPFASHDAAATLARTVADPATPLRKWRPDLPRELDRIVLRGLEKSQDRRWKSVDAFRSALEPFAPGTVFIGGLVLRVAAYLIDFMVFMFVAFIVGILSVFSRPVPRLRPEEIHYLTLAAFWGYWFLTDWLYGCSFGKWILRLRVRNASNEDPPGLGKALGRSLVFTGVISLQGEFTFWTTVGGLGHIVPRWTAVVALLLQYPILFSTMRVRNGFRGVHEVLSGTRVVQMPWRSRSTHVVLSGPDRLADALDPVDQLPKQLGPYEIVGAFFGQDRPDMLLAKDPALDRTVLLHLTDEAMSSARSQVNRSTRLRWVAGGDYEGRHWNAFAISSGFPLSDRLNPNHPLSFRELYPVFLQLCEELSAACQDGTLPDTLSTAQVWVQANGQVALLDAPLEPTTDLSPVGGAAEERSRWLLQRVLQQALEGTRRNPKDVSSRVLAPLSEHSQRILSRVLTDSPEPLSLDPFTKEVRELGHTPLELDRATRVGHLAFLSLGAILLVVGIALCITGLQAVVENTSDAVPPAWAIPLAAISTVSVLHALWTYFTRGGLLFRLVNIRLVRGDGLPARRGQCAVRTLLFCVPVLLISALFLLGVSLAMDSGPMEMFIMLVFFWSVMFLSYIPMALWHPPQAWHDRLAGTYLVFRK